MIAVGKLVEGHLVIQTKLLLVNTIGILYSDLPWFELMVIVVIFELVFKQMSSQNYYINFT